MLLKYIHTVAVVIIFSSASFAAIAADDQERDARSFFHEAFFLTGQIDPQGANLRTLKSLLQENKQFVNHQCNEDSYVCRCCDMSWKGATLLMIAAHEGDIGATKTFLGYGAKKDIEWRGDTALTLAVAQQEYYQLKIKEEKDELGQLYDDDDEVPAIQARIKVHTRKIGVFNRVLELLYEKAAAKQQVQVPHNGHRDKKKSPEERAQEKARQEEKTQRNREKRLRQKENMRKREERELEEILHPEGSQVLDIKNHLLPLTRFGQSASQSLAERMRAMLEEKKNKRTAGS